ncbi:hypothetical protein [Rhizobium oryzicola]|uniref:Flagellin n=1 Tax=Rhizobium oryzicola TaxID=1232668 RepID=A0ABT8SV48_9HYPH|nr:hypothetical protein [Rhizobium oryzicola]MDO1582309.1 hypothetical protein [Rhizobium oryzicola]
MKISDHAYFLNAPTATGISAASPARRNPVAVQDVNASQADAYWSISTTVKPSSLSLSNTEDAQATSAAVADSALLGLKSATSIVGEIQSTLQAAKAIGSDRQALGARIEGLKNKLASVVDGSGFAGQNWLKTGPYESPKMKSVVGSVTAAADGGVSINVLNVDQGAFNHIAEGHADDGILTRRYSGITPSGSPYSYSVLGSHAGNRSGEISLSAATSGDQVDGMIASLRAVMADMISASADIRGTSQRISSSADFVVSLHKDLPQTSAPQSLNTSLDERAARLLAQAVQTGLQSSGLNITNASMARNLDIYA